LVAPCQASTFSPINLWHVRLEAGQQVDLTTRDGHNTIVFCRTGSVRVGDAGEALKPVYMEVELREAMMDYQNGRMGRGR